MHRTLQSEKGMALLMALGAIVIIGVLIGGVVFVTTQDYRVGSNTVRQARAEAAAELGLNRLPQDWNLADNQRLRVGDTLTKSYTAPRGASVKVTVTKVSGVAFWAVSEGTAGALGSQATARRRYGTMFRLDMPQMNFLGAITTQGNTTVNGNVTVNGNDAPPAGWTACGTSGQNGSRSGHLAGRRGLHGGGQLHVRWSSHRAWRAQDDGDRQQDHGRRDGGERPGKRRRRALREHVATVLLLRPDLRPVGVGLPQAGQGTRLGGRVLRATRVSRRKPSRACVPAPLHGGARSVWAHAPTRFRFSPSKVAT